MALIFPRFDKVTNSWSYDYQAKGVAGPVSVVIKADAIAKQKTQKCQHCHRQTEQLCGGCSWRVCPQHSWTEVTRETNGARLRELCWACRDKYLGSQ